VELLPAQQRIDLSWYAGTADAIHQNLDIIRNHKPSYILILAGDHIYKMDYGPMIAAHVERGADATVGCIEVPLERASAFGVIAINDEQRITAFLENRKSRSQCQAARTWRSPAWASMYSVLPSCTSS